jgi:hypothetical protein
MTLSSSLKIMEIHNARFSVGGAKFGMFFLPAAIFFLATKYHPPLLAFLFFCFFKNH